MKSTSSNIIIFYIVHPVDFAKNLNDSGDLIIPNLGSPSQSKLTLRPFLGRPNIVCDFRIADAFLVLEVVFPFADVSSGDYYCWIFHASGFGLAAFQRRVFGRMREDIAPIRLASIIKGLFALRFGYGQAHDFP